MNKKILWGVMLSTCSNVYSEPALPEGEALGEFLLFLANSTEHDGDIITPIDLEALTSERLTNATTKPEKIDEEDE